MDRPTADRDTTELKLVSIVLPAFNEAAILRPNLQAVRSYLEAHSDEFRWEMVIVNDGSSDETGQIAEDFAAGLGNVRVLHHKRNYGLGQALRYGISRTRGDYVVTLDIDLSYSPEHITSLLDALKDTHAKLVLASPYMKGGRISNVPWLRRVLSVGANWFLSLVAHGNLSTLTCMVRGYDGVFARELVLRSTGMDIMPETIYKTMILRAGIEQIPAHLDWGLQVKQTKRKSSMRILRHMLSTVLSGFVFRPFMFFILPGLVLLSFAAWVNLWMVIHFFESFQRVPADLATDRISWAIAEAYASYPHTFIVGLLSLMLSIQLISLGILALQSKSYFEEIYFLGASQFPPRPKTGSDD
ncbi:MAG: glycosyltransferase family 2 protein [Gammaproteobacteria bacterium]|nr:glycosyltransferase family 2 protein [Gammaproteobacteria bacterium]